MEYKRSELTYLLGIDMFNHLLKIGIIKRNPNDENYILNPEDILRHAQNLESAREIVPYCKACFDLGLRTNYVCETLFKNAVFSGDYSGAATYIVIWAECYRGKHPGKDLPLYMKFYMYLVNYITGFATKNEVYSNMIDAFVRNRLAYNDVVRIHCIFLRSDQETFKKYGHSALLSLRIAEDEALSGNFYSALKYITDVQRYSETLRCRFSLLHNLIYDCYKKDEQILNENGVRAAKGEKMQPPMVDSDIYPEQLEASLPTKSSQCHGVILKLIDQKRWGDLFNIFCRGNTEFLAKNYGIKFSQSTIKSIIFLSRLLLAIDRGLEIVQIRVEKATSCDYDPAVEPYSYIDQRRYLTAYARFQYNCDPCINTSPVFLLLKAVVEHYLTPEELAEVTTQAEAKHHRLAALYATSQTATTVE